MVVVVGSVVDLRGAHITFWGDGTVPYVHRVIVTQVTICFFYYELYLSKVLGENIWVWAFALNVQGHWHSI